MSNKKLTIQKTKLVLAEGADAYFFLIWALEAYKINDVQVMNFGGIDELDNFMNVLTQLDGFDDVESLVVARDAETNYQNALDNVKNSFTRNNLFAPDNAFEFNEAKPRAAIMIFPGYNSNGQPENGCLENLCLKTINDPVLESAKSFLRHINDNHEQLSHEHKSLVHSYLSVKNKFVGSKLGEAARFGAWNWQADVLEPFKRILENA